MNRLAAAMLALAGLLKLVPVSGVLGAEVLQRLYGVAIPAPDLLLLMRHRAILLGLVGALLIAAIFERAWRPPAFAVGLVSAASFLALGWPPGQLSAALRQVFCLDVVVAAALCVGLAAHHAGKAGFSRPTKD